VYWLKAIGSSLIYIIIGGTSEGHPEERLHDRKHIRGEEEEMLIDGP
jgi:hypothetical protein